MVALINVSADPFSSARKNLLKVVDTTGEQGREAQLERLAPYSLYIVSGGSSLSLFGSSSRTVTFENTNIV